MTEDAPELLKDPVEQAHRLAMLDSPHMKPLTDYLASVRAALGEQYHIPDFDPCDGGIHARVLFLLEAPGPKAVTSKFVSSNNPDPTAKNLWNLIHNAGIARTDTLIWNIVPWYIGENGHIKPAPKEDIKQAMPYLKDLLLLLPNLELIMLVGGKAQSAGLQIRQFTSLPIKYTHHMSARVFNVWPEKRRLIQEAFGDIAKELSERRE